jgi:hypothetical protein
MAEKEKRDQPIPDQLIQIAHEQEGGAERVISQIEVVQSSFEEIQNLAKECNEILSRLMPPSEGRDNLIARIEEIGVHADNGMYNVSGVFDLFQYQDIVRQKLEKVGHRLIDVSEYIQANLVPREESTRHAPSGRDILEREGQAADQAKDDADAVVAEFFAKLRAQKQAKAT